MVINGSFNIYEAYTVKLVTYEYDLKSVETKAVKSEPLPEPAEGMSVYKSVQYVRKN